MERDECGRTGEQLREVDGAGMTPEGAPAHHNAHTHTATEVAMGRRDVTGGACEGPPADLDGSEARWRMDEGWESLTTSAP